MAKTPTPADTVTKPSASNTSLLWWGAAALSLLLGFVDLWRGGDTAAPILLVLGYLVFIPIAILKR